MRNCIGIPPKKINRAATEDGKGQVRKYKFDHTTVGETKSNGKKLIIQDPTPIPESGEKENGFRKITAWILGLKKISGGRGM